MTASTVDPRAFLAGALFGGVLGALGAWVLSRAEPVEETAAERGPARSVSVKTAGAPEARERANELLPSVPRETGPAEAPSEAVREPVEPPDDPTLMPTAVLDRQCILDGILLDAQGEALGGQHLDVQILFGEHVVRRQTMTAADGAFQTSFTGAIPPGVAGVLRLQPAPPPRRGIHPDEPATAIARTDLPHPLPAGNVDVGMLQLQPLPLVVAGMVSTDEGPLEGAKVSLTVHRGTRHPSGYELRTDAEGRFELRLEGEVRGGELSVSYEQWAPRGNIPFEAGQGDLRVHLAAAGDVLGEVSCPVGHEDGLRFELIDRHGVRHDAPVRWIGTQDGKMSFAFRNLPLGSARLDVSDPRGRRLDRAVEITRGEQRLKLDLR